MHPMTAMSAPMNRTHQSQLPISVKAMSYMARIAAITMATPATSMPMEKGAALSTWTGFDMARDIVKRLFNVSGRAAQPDCSAIVQEEQVDHFEVRRRTLGPRDLFALSVVAVLALALLSSPDGVEVSTFDEMEPGGKSVVVCTIQRCHPSDNGWLLNLTDTAGGYIDAFCRYGDADGTPLNGSAVRIWAQPSEDEPSFFFISRMEMLPLPEVRGGRID